MALVLSAHRAEAQVTTLRSLAFGTVTSGSTTTVAKTSASAAEWRLSGLFVLGGSFQLTLPTALTGPGAAIPIVFGPTDGQRNTSNTPTGGSSFDPRAPQSISPLTVTTTIYVWLGGSISPPLRQTPGAYAGTVVLTVSAIV